MRKNTSIVLSEHFQTFIDGQVAEGRYGSASEVVRAGLRLLEHQEARMAALRAALAEGKASGFIDDFNFDEFITEKLRDEGVSE
ncbi:MAG TPA: type II toxin-antitoxin system ParD family antitoxin [Caulobacter sp.]|nr:type II toxin-antitoxin system ParD family antitoxin [Caulobacter sp.]